jgi:hypothetical protein
VLLLSGLKLIEALGGSKSRGAGACRVDLSAAVLRIDGRTVSIQQQLAHIEHLPMYSAEREARS